MFKKYLFSKIIMISTLVFILTISKDTNADDVIVFTAHQDWLSRIYIMNMDGSVYDFQQFDFYYWADVEVVNNELYVSDAYAPRVYKVDLSNWDLEVIIDDWSLYYFYGLAFDSTYFYLDEWDMNRYDINGNAAGTASFDEDVMGMAWDGDYLWILNDNGQIKCIDIENWPNLTEVSGNNFNSPTNYCKGLWFDGEYFWSAESKENIGNIYKFNYDGQIMQQWTEPAFSGFGVCVIKDFITDVNSEITPSKRIFHLYQNYPNPLYLSDNSKSNYNRTCKTTIKFTISENSYTTLKIYNISGKLVETLIANNLTAGKHKKVWNAKNFSSGIYLYQLKTDNYVETKKMLILE